jgi:hypothetical protein
MESVSQKTSILYADKTLEHISSVLQISREEIVRQSILAFLEKKQREIQAEILLLSGKYGIHTVQEFENLYKEGKLEENGTFEDFQKMDLLEFKIDQIQKLKKEFA